MKKILIATSLLIGTFAWAEPHGLDVIAQNTNPHPSHSTHKGSTTETVVDDVLTIILDQGFAGALILILFVWTFRTDKANRASQKENFDKFVEISSECSGHMASVSARLENIERELEQAKQLEMLTASRKG